MKSMPLAILYAIASGALSTAVVHPAMAQQTAADAMPAPQRVVVTGSNISRADQETPSPVQVISADDLKKSGYTSVSDVLRNITANGQGTLSQSFSGAFAKGATGVALRGLTVGATLVLIDGHRMAPYPLSDDGQRAFVDISNIPFDAVERIDIVKDGASAVYGSDAIAGVVNVILKKSYTGTNLTAEQGTSQAGGGNAVHAAVTHGMGDLDKDGYSAYLSAEYRHTDPIRLDQRAGQSWTDGDWTSRGGININPGVPNISNAGLTSPNTPFLYNPKGTGGANNPANYAFAPGCDFTSYKAGQCAIKDPYTQLQPETQNINLLASVTKKLGGDWLLNVKASALDSKDTIVTGLPARFPAGNYLGNTSLGPGVTIAQVGVIPSFLVPANYPGNTLGAPARVYGMVPGLGPGIDGIDSKSYRVAADLSGTWSGWDVNAAAGYTKIVTDQTFYNVVNNTALYNALNSPTNPFLITGGNSPAAMAAVAQTVTGQTSAELDFLEARASHEVMPLGGGTMSFSGGLSFVHRKLD
ncbi:MAG TPA: TonB-dependent receptor plug domain-containing protein, partial [Telluria sp.]|nr:TonB-dependent receptor plug domain-containing protein [Telluria sp.]